MAANREYRSFNPLKDIEDARRPSFSWYTEDSVWHDEQREIFEKCWVPVGRTDQVSKSGDMFIGHIVGNPYVVLRDEQGVLRAFHNVCRHAAAAVVDRCANRNELVCPYHGWTYGLDGKLKKAPHMGKMGDFNAAHEGMKPIAVDTWGPFIFLDLDAYWNSERGLNARSLEKDIQGLKLALDESGMANFRFHSQKIYALNCNWKVFVDNSLDGGYHVGYIHEALASGLDSSVLETQIFDHGRSSLQFGKGKTERLGEKVIYAHLFPNFFVNRYGNTMETNTVMPLTVDKCLVVFDYYFDYPDFNEFATQKRIMDNIDSADKTQLEDIKICESVQRGMKSMAYECGRYSEKFEKLVYAFHTCVWENLDKRAPV
jgi:choline monooxygenase